MSDETQSDRASAIRLRQVRPGAIDVLVLGGGLFGSAVAFHLARAGAARLLQYEGNAGPSASSRSAGILTYVGWDPWDLELLRWSAEEFAFLSEATGLGDYRESGAIRISRTPEGEQWLERARLEIERSGVASHRASVEEVDSFVPGSDFSDLRAALSTPSDATFSSEGMTVAYQRLAMGLGVEIVKGRTPATIRQTPGGWRVDVEGTSLTARALVLACGAWSPGLLAGLGQALPLAPFRTQAMRVRPRPLSRPFPTVHDLDLEIYVRPAGQGRLLLGNGNEHKEADPFRADPQADPSFVERLRGLLDALFPGRSSWSVERAWAGLCVASPDRFPLVGPVPDADRLYVASGFNGLGAMRAPALAARLAEGILSDRWASLEPANPSRFSERTARFDPRPEFPLERDEPLPPSARTPAPASTLRPAVPDDVGPLQFKPLRSLREVERTELPALSDWFDPFLPLFMKDALRTRGEVEVAERQGEVVGVYLYSPTEGVGSVFTGSRAVALHYVPGRSPGGVYAERPWVEGGERIAILAADLRDWVASGPIRNPVRIAEPVDLPRIVPVMREQTGAVDQDWFRTLPRPEELCFFCEVDGRVAGVSWASVVGPHARGHSFMVHPRYRGLGIGTDLLQARMTWLQELGVRTVVSEIYEGNVASTTAAERAGMAEVDWMFHFPPRENR